MNSNKTNQLATLTAGLGAMSVNASVGMDEVVSIFICRLEEDLHAQRKSCQSAMIRLNDEIKTLTTQLLATCGAAIASVERVIEDDFVKITISLDSKEPTINWNDNQVTYVVRQKTESKMIGKNNYSPSSSHSVSVALPIDDGIKFVYDNVMGQKAKLTDRMNLIQSELRDLARRERAVRAKVAEMKLTEAGMGDLLENNELLKLVNLDNIIEG